MDCYLGMIFPWTPSFAPRGFSYCRGQILTIAQNAALFSLMGNHWGGDGVNNFNLPDLRGRVPVGSGTSSLGTSYVLGRTGGQETVTLLQNHLPTHTHTATFTPTTTTYNFSIPERPAAGTLNTSVVTEIVGGDTTAQDPAAGGSYYLTGVKGSSQGPVTTTAPTDTTRANLLGTTVTVTPSADFSPNIPRQDFTITTPTSGIVTIAPAGSSQALDTRSPFTTVDYIICVQGLYPSRN